MQVSVNIVSIAIASSSISISIFNFPGCGYLQSSSLFQCQSSSDQSGQVYTPNIPNFYFNHVNAADFRTSGGSLIDSPIMLKRWRRETQIFTIPPESAPRNCSDSLVSIQYCYRARDRDINVEQTIFILSSLISLNQQGLFEVKNISIIRNTPRNSTCVAIDSPGKIQQICCDTTPLSGLQIPSSEYAFGVTVTDPVNVRPLAFRNNITQYRISQISAALGNTGPPQGSRFTLNESNSVNYTYRSLLLLRFIIGM